MTSPYLPTYYGDGTINVTEGETEFTGLDTLWDGFVWDGDLLFLPSQPLVPPVRIASVSGNGTGQLAYPWPGETATDADYEIRFVGMVERSTVQSRRVIEQLRTVAAHGRGLFLYFDDGTADADPGPGRVRLNATPAAATEGYIDVLDAEGASIAGLIDHWGSGDSTSRGWIELRSLARPSNAFIYELTNIETATGYRRLALELLDGSGTLEAGEALMVALVPRGDQGDSFTSDTTAANLAARAAFNSQPAGYTVLVADDGGSPPRSRFDRRVGAAGTWVTIGYLTGNQGIQGVQGEKGWSPQLVLVADGARRVFKLLGYTGGAGVAPTANVGQYLKGDGTFTATIGDAVDVRGQAGMGTVGEVVAGDGLSRNNTDPTAPILAVNISAALDLIGSVAQGDLVYRGASSWARLAKGTAGQLLRQNPALTAPEWKDSWEVIAYGSAAGVSALAYTDLGAFREIRCRGGLTPSINTGMVFELTVDNGATWINTGGAYDRSLLVVDGSNTTAAARLGSAEDVLFLHILDDVSNGYIFTLNELMITNFNKTTHKGHRNSVVFINGAVTKQIAAVSQGRIQASACNGFRIRAPGATLTSYGFLVEGLRG